MSNGTKVLGKDEHIGKRIKEFLLNNALIITMAVAVIYIAIKNPNFIRTASVINILSQTAAYLPAALGIGGCIVLTGTDLSAGRVVGLTACISASLLQNAANVANKMWPQIGTLPIPVVILLAMMIGALVGCFNGFFVAKFKLHPFIVTLGTQLILYTCLLLYVQQGNNKGMAISNLDASYTNFVKGALFKIKGVPVPGMFCLPLSLPLLCGLSGIKPLSARICSRSAPMRKPPVFPASMYSPSPSAYLRWQAPCTASPASSRAPVSPPIPPIPA